MSEYLRKYWFVTLVAVILCGGLIYYIYDLNKDNVSAKTVDSKQVVASTTLGDVNADYIFDQYQNFNTSMLYNMYRRAVIDQTVEATSDMETEAKTMAKTIEANVKSDTTNKTKYSIMSELASYGFDGDNALYDYCLMATKMEAMDEEYVKANFETLKKEINTNPRTISVIAINVANPSELTDAEKTKKENIDKALEKGDSFADTATAFSEDTATAAKKGYYGYVDSATTALDASVVQAALGLEKGKASDWITVTDSKSGASYLYKVQVDETDLNAILDSESKDVRKALISSLLTADPTVDMKALQEKAKGLEIKWDNEEAKTKVEKYINDQLKGADNA
ncbi:MAG: peptidylprolyl isomerase [Erysipelotrichaceae bacterium]|nr:peptidylprolyl isomerase [Erysipelotrichaceae bacterium]